MLKPWHGKIAALSLLHLIRDNMGERQSSSTTSSRGVEEEVCVAHGCEKWGGGEAELKGRYT